MGKASGSAGPRLVLEDAVNGSTRELSEALDAVERIVELEGMGMGRGGGKVVTTRWRRGNNCETGATMCVKVASC